jgi:hypothetical protein
MGIFAARKIIGLDTIIKRKNDMLFNEIDGEVVILSIENSEYFGLDMIGSRIWELLEQPLSFKNLVTSLLEEYEVTEQQCIEDTLIFLNKLVDKKLIITN